MHRRCRRSLGGTPGVVVIGDGVNLGFSGGCNLGAVARDR